MVEADAAPDAAERASLLAALAWQIELGADEAIGDAPVDRFAAAPPLPEPAAVAASPVDARDLPALRRALESFDGCGFRAGARSLVFAEGLPGARVMVVGGVPGREEDRAGAPFRGEAGALLDAMFAAIGLARTATEPAAALYVAMALPWRTPQDRAPTADECACLAPFLHRHVALARPQVVVTLGSLAARMLTEGAPPRGQWTEALGRRLLPLAAPAEMLRDPGLKRPTWAGLLALQAHLRKGTTQ